MVNPLAPTYLMRDIVVRDKVVRKGMTAELPAHLFMNRQNFVKF